MAIEEYRSEEQGFHPVLQSEGWQVAHLSYLPKLGFDAIGCLERHQMTDEAFVPFSGNSVLVAASDAEIEARKMAPGVIYNVPRGVWHWILMNPGDRVVIAERAGTHLTDVEYRDLTPAERASLTEALGRLTRSPQ